MDIPKFETKEQAISELCAGMLQLYVKQVEESGNAMTNRYYTEGAAAYRELIFQGLLRIADCQGCVGDEAFAAFSETIIYCLMCVGDVAALPAVIDRQDDSYSLLNVNFTQELFKELIERPTIVYDVLFETGTDYCEANDVSLGDVVDRIFTSYEVPEFDGVDVFKYLNFMYKHGDFARGCYYVACLLIYRFATTLMWMHDVFFGGDGDEEVMMEDD